jgi:hypothetical protein
MGEISSPIFSQNRRNFDSYFFSKWEKAAIKFFKQEGGTLPQPPPLAPPLELSHSIAIIFVASTAKIAKEKTLKMDKNH